MSQILCWGKIAYFFQSWLVLRTHSKHAEYICFTSGQRAHLIKLKIVCCEKCEVYITILLRMGVVVFMFWGQGLQLCRAPARACLHLISQAASQLLLAVLLSSDPASTAPSTAGACAFSHLQIRGHPNTQECLVSCCVRKELILPLSTSRQAVPEAYS